MNKLSEYSKVLAAAVVIRSSLAFGGIGPTTPDVDAPDFLRCTPAQENSFVSYISIGWDRVNVRYNSPEESLYLVSSVYSGPVIRLEHGHYGKVLGLYHMNFNGITTLDDDTRVPYRGYLGATRGDFFRRNPSFYLELNLKHNDEDTQSVLPSDVEYLRSRELDGLDVHCNYIYFQ